MKYRAFGMIGALLCIFALCSCKNKNREEQPVETTSAETGSASVTVTTEHVTEPHKITAEYDLTYKITDGEVTILGYKGTDENVVIPDEILGCPVTQIRVSAFADSDITELTLPDTMTEFKGLKSLAKLKTLNLPKGLESFGGNLFGLDSLENVNIIDGENFTSKDGVLYSRDGKTIVYYPQGRTGGFAVPEGVEAIESHAFRYSAITEITLPKTLKSIGNGAFSDSGITELDIPASVTEIGGRILGGNKELCISAEESGDHTVNLDYYNVIYRDDTTLKKAIRLADDYSGTKIFVDLNFDSFPEMICVWEYNCSIMNYDADNEQWEYYGIYEWYHYLTDAGLELYYDKENDVYFYTYYKLDYGREYSAYKSYVCRDGFACKCIGQESLYSSWEGEKCNVFYSDHVGGEFDFGFYESEMPVGIDRLDKAGSAFIELTHKALEKYEYIDTIDIKGLLEQSVDGENVFAGEFADEPNTSRLPESAPEENLPMFCSYAYGELAGEEVFERLSQNPNLTYYEIDDYLDDYQTVDLTGIEKLKSVKEFTIRCDAENPEKIAELENVEILHLTSELSDLSFISEMKNLKVLEIYNCVFESEDYFAPIYGCENIEYLLCAKSNVNEGQLKALKENMPWVEIFLYNSNSG